MEADAHFGHGRGGGFGISRPRAVGGGCPCPIGSILDDNTGTQRSGRRCHLGVPIRVSGGQRSQLRVSGDRIVIQPKELDGAGLGQQLAELVRPQVMLRLPVRVWAGRRLGMGQAASRRIERRVVFARKKDTEREVSLFAFGGQLAERLTFALGGGGEVEGRMRRGEQTKPMRILGGDHQVMHPGRPGGANPLFGLELRWIKRHCRLRV